MVHLQETDVEFVDKSAAAISGVVKYDGSVFSQERFDDPKKCPYPDPLSLKRGEATTECICPVVKPRLSIKRGERGYDDLKVEDDGTFETSAGNGDKVTLELDPYEGLPPAGVSGVGEAHAFEVVVKFFEDDEVVEGDDPEAYTATETEGGGWEISWIADVEADVEIIFNDVTLVPTGAAVVDGGGNVADYITGTSQCENRPVDFRPHSPRD